MIYENSRYLHTTMSTRLGWDVPTLDIRKRFTFNEDNCQTYEWIEGDTLDGVAYKFYGICALRWAILDANPKYRTEFDIKNGDRILIPDYEEVVDIVNV
jgi:phage tail protein X